MMTLQTSNTIKKLKFLWVIPGIIIIAMACSELDDKYAEPDAIESAGVTTFEIKDGMIFIIDGEIFEMHEKIIFEVLQPGDIESINVIKDDSGMEKYGNIAKNGVVEIVTKSDNFVERLIAFSEKNAPNLPEVPQTDNKGNQLFMVVEQMPQFPGGEEALMNYLSTSVKYPQEAVEEGIKGRVFIQCIINTEGRPEQLKVLKSVHPLLDNEAMRVIEEMPTWKPGTQRGRNVSVTYTIPINFEIPE